MTDSSSSAIDAGRDATADRRAREIVVRFSHVDAAGIVFYPRFLEMLAQTYPDLVPVDGARGRYTFGFRRPILLGDRLLLVLDNEVSAHAWRISGQVSGQERLSVTYEAVDPASLPVNRQPVDGTQFVSDSLPVLDWCVGATAQLHLSRYYEWVNTAIEQWFARSLGLPFRKLNENRHGIPTVSLETDCVGLPQRGAQVRISIRPLAVGARSLRFESCLADAERCYAITTQVIVFVNLIEGGAESIEWPDAVRQRALAQLAGAPTQ